MSRLSLSDAERWAGNAAGNYLERALRIVAEQCGRSSTLCRDPGAVALEFKEIVAALIEAQSLDTMASVLCGGLEDISTPLVAAAHELSALITRNEDAQSRGRP